MKAFIVKNWRYILVFFAVKFFIVSFFLMAMTAHASTYTEVYPTITGNVLSDNQCPSIYGNAPILGFRTYYGIYPDTSNEIFNKTNGLYQVCGVYYNQASYGTSILYFFSDYWTASTTYKQNGTYWTVLTFDGVPYVSSDFSGDLYYFQYEYNSGVFYTSTNTIPFIPIQLVGATVTISCAGSILENNMQSFRKYVNNTDLAGANVPSPPNECNGITPIPISQILNDKISANANFPFTWKLYYFDSTYPNGNILGYSALYFTSTTTATPIQNVQTQYNCNDPTSRILDFNPQDGTTTGNNVNFSLYACVNSQDIGLISGINIRLHNIDQNWIIAGGLLSPNDIFLVKETDIQTSGLFTYASTTNIADGNYRLEACIDKAYFWGWIRNPFSDITECVSHQFLVNQGTFIGNISQNAWRETNDFINSVSATSSRALMEKCNPLGGFLSGTSTFDITLCMTGLLVPDADTLTQTFEDIRKTVLQRFPFGYLTRFISIISNPATTTLPTWTAVVQIGAGNDLTPETTSITIDPSDMLAGGATLLDSIQDPNNGKTAKDIFKPMVQLMIALSILMIIVRDLTKLKHKDGESRQTKLS